MNTDDCKQMADNNNPRTKRTLSHDDIIEMCESVEVIQEVTFLLREEIDKLVEKDNPERVDIDFMIEQIYDLAFTATMHVNTLMYP